MKTLIGPLCVLTLGAAASLSAMGCQVGCIEDSSGTTCSSKSLERFDGAASAPQVLDRAPGAGVTIDVLYGEVLVQRSGSGKVEAQFFPFVYAGYDEKASADQQLAQNLRTSAASAGGIAVSVRREGGTNGLGANTVVRLPDDFDGILNIVNHGDGPLNHFDVKVEFLARASALSITNHADLGNCWVQGAASVRNTTVQCAEDISVFDVSDEVNITNTETMHDADTAAVTLRMVGITPGTRGGKVTAASGTILATFPRTGGYVLNARSPVKGTVQEGAVPPNCERQQVSPSAKTILCGSGPVYELIAGSSPNHPGRTPPDNNVLLKYQ